MMSKAILILLAFVLIFRPAHSATKEPTVVACTFEKLPLMIMTIRGGMGASDNTLQVGQTQPVLLEIGSGMTTATHGKQDFIFSLRSPASVTVNAAGSDSRTFSGECISTLQP
jgi:hypothetical protein